MSGDAESLKGCPVKSPVLMDNGHLCYFFDMSGVGHEMNHARRFRRPGPEIAPTSGMSTVPRLSLADRIAEHLREGILAGRWQSTLPGLRPLSAELGVARHTLRDAILQLVSEGLLVGGAVRKPYVIVTRPSVKKTARAKVLRIALLLPGPPERDGVLVQAQLLRVVTEVRAEGHDCVILFLPAKKSPGETGYLRRMVGETAADAWLIHRGPLEVLEWFVRNKVPALAMGGRSTELPLAATGWSFDSVTREATRRLLALGHRRIVILSGRLARRPSPGPVIGAFREELERAGVRPGDYNIPDWEETPEGISHLMDSLFRVTPPTALLCWTVNSTFGALSWLARNGFRVPEDVSVVALRDDPSLAWHFPGMRIACAGGSDAFFFRRIREWVAGVAAGLPDTRQAWSEVRLNDGTTVGPVKAG